MSSNNKFLNNKKVLITGADGFIGSHLVESLVKNNCNIRALVMYNSFNTWGWLDTLDKSILNHIEVCPGDISDNKSVNKLCKGIDYVFHLASLIAIPYSYNSPYSYLQTNALGTMNLLESCLNSNVEKIIHTSTSEVYGNFSRIPIDEKTPVFAKSPYSATKIAADQIAYSYYKSFNLPISIIRPFNTYGPRQSNRAIIPTIITQMLDNKKRIKLGSLYPTRDFSFIKDTVNGFIAAAKHNKSIGEVINIGSGYEISIGELVKLIGQLMKIEYTVKKDRKRVRPAKGEVDRLRANNNKALSLIKWKPIYAGKNGLKKGLKETVEWFKEPKNLNKYKSKIYNL